MMKIKNKGICYLLTLFFAVNNICFSNATSYDEYGGDNYEDLEYVTENYDSYDYYIKNMNVDVEVNEKREYIVTETIDVYFNEERHGIIRNIPTQSSLEKVKIEDISVKGDDSSIKEYSSGIDIKIGSADRVITGDKRYVIKYTLKHYADNVEHGDYMYMNLHGSDWDVPVLNFNATITYPPSFNLQSINLTDGEYGSTDNTLVGYSQVGNKVKVYSKTVIPSFEAVTINMEFEEGAFSQAPINIMNYGTSIVRVMNFALILVVIYLILISRNRIKSIIKPIEFYPSKDLSPLEVGYIYNGKVTSEMIVSCIYKWASDGYIKISIEEDKADAKIKFTNNDMITLERVKELDMGPNFERRLFKKIFSCGKGGKVTDSQLVYKLASEFTMLKKDLKQKYRKDEKFKKRGSILPSIIVMIAVALIVLGTTFLEYDAGQDFSIILMFILVAMFSFSQLKSEMDSSYYDYNKSFWKNAGKEGNMMNVWIMILMFLFISYIVLESRYSLSDWIFLNAPLFIVIWCSSMIQERKSSYEEEIYGKICGFREFIENAEKDRLEMLMSENPEYFYHILPYAQVLGVTEVWTDKFKDIDMVKSEYYGCSAYSTIRLSNALESSVSNATAYQSSSNGSSGGGFSGGGCSGGGSGGGGGRSW